MIYRSGLSPQNFTRTESTTCFTRPSEGIQSLKFHLRGRHDQRNQLTALRSKAASKDD